MTNGFKWNEHNLIKHNGKIYEVLFGEIPKLAI